MEPIRIFLFSFAILTVFTITSQAQIFGIGHLGPDGLSTLYQINPRNGTTTTIGPIGFERCGGMDFDADGNLFATCERSDGSDSPVLVTINPLTGIGAEVGPTGINSSIGDISFRNSDGALYAYDGISDPEHTVYILNTSTGQATLVGDAGLSNASGNGMTFNLADTLLQSQSRGGIPRLYVINQESGQAVFVKELVVDGPPQMVAYRLAAMDVRPGAGQIYGILNDSRGNTGDFGPRFLATLNIESGIISIIGQTADGMDAIAIGKTTSVPSLSGIGTVILVVVLLVSILIVLKQRRGIKI